VTDPILEPVVNGAGAIENQKEILRSIPRRTFRPRIPKKFIFNALLAFVSTVSIERKSSSVSRGIPEEVVPERSMTNEQDLVPTQRA